MNAYLQLVRRMSTQFDTFTLTKIPRGENTSADALASLAATSDPSQKRIIPVEGIESPSIAQAVNSISSSASSDEVIRSAEVAETVDNAANQPNWMSDIRAYLTDGTTPTDRWAARRLKAKCARYTLLDKDLYRWSTSGVLLRCVTHREAQGIMKELHEGAGGNHAGGRSLAHQIKLQGFFWPTLMTDCEQFTRECDKCQRHAPIIHAPTEHLQTVALPYPFMRWAMDIVGPLPPSRQKRFLLVMTDYFTKWVEADSYGNIRDIDVQKFVWKNIICRHGLPYEIITDNGPQFTSAKFENFCSRWKIQLRHSTPRYPQGNGQAEATNKTLLDGLKKRLDAKKGAWADELDGVLWSHRTTPRRATGHTPFSLSHGVEAMSPAEVGIPGVRRNWLAENPETNDIMLCNNNDLIEEKRDQALLRIQNYQQLAAKYYNERTKARPLSEGDLVLRKVFENTTELNAGKLGTNWEGPYQITKVIKPGVYELMTMEGDLIPRSWNSMNLKRYSV